MSDIDSKSDYQSDSATDADSEPESQYNPDDTDDEIPDPNLDTNCLFQDRNRLPKALSRLHFKPGLVYLLTLGDDKDVTYLGLMIEAMSKTFIFRVYNTKGKTRKTFHTAAADKEWRYAEVWRLAPQRKLMMR